jgi:hypothetical protein
MDHNTSSYFIWFLAGAEWLGSTYGSGWKYEAINRRPIGAGYVNLGGNYRISFWGLGDGWADGRGTCYGDGFHYRY